MLNLDVGQAPSSLAGTLAEPWRAAGRGTEHLAGSYLKGSSVKDRAFQDSPKLIARIHCAGESHSVT